MFLFLLLFLFLDLVLLFFLFFKVFLYLFFSFLAFVSGFNKRCFLRGRCSMEMWCPDDIGRDSWDWVGPPAWERACFNSPEWGGGSSPVKTETPQIVLLLLLCCFGKCIMRVYVHIDIMQRQSLRLIYMSSSHR